MIGYNLRPRRGHFMNLFIRYLRSADINRELIRRVNNSLVNLSSRRLDVKISHNGLNYIPRAAGVMVTAGPGIRVATLYGHPLPPN